MKYATSWFLIDVTSTIPFDLILSYGHLNKIARFSRIGKLYKVIRILKIIRLIKIIKVNNKLTRHLSDLLKIDAGTERLLYLMMIFFVL